MFGAESSPRIGRGEARFHAIADVAPDSIPLVDRKRLERVTFGEPEFRAELLEMFFAEADRQMTALAGAISSGSSDIALRAAHALKGAAANVGAVQMRELARELEVVVRSGGLEFAMSLLDRLRAAQTATRAALEAE
jgi:HPt (histidine-containing phosphotransfer) domain-containing protein